MAPLRDPPKKADRPLKSILKKTSSGSGVLSSSAKEDALFPSSKKDKRRIKHAQLISKVTKASSSKKPRRRRPNKKLVTTLDALADALPDDDDGVETGTASTAGARPDQQVNIIKRKSIKSRPGALKRREEVDSSERDRFAKNMAQLVTTMPTDSVASSGQTGDKTSAPPTAPSTANRWAALRGFISQTLETRPQTNSTTT